MKLFACILATSLALLCACKTAIPSPTTSPSLSTSETLPMTYVGSPHFDPGDPTIRRVDTIVIHTTEGKFDESKDFHANQRRAYEGAIRWFLNPKAKVSSHYVIGPDGEITQMVQEEDVAWHATYYNKKSIGIEMAGWSHRAGTWNEKNLDTLVRLVAQLAVRHKVAIYHPESDASTEGGHFYSVGIVGHGQIQTPGTPAGEKSPRTDPGPHFPWDDFIKRVRNEARNLKDSR